MKKKEKEQDENPLHKEFGILGNIRYCFQNIKKYKPILILFIVLGVANHTCKVITKKSRPKWTA